MSVMVILNPLEVPSMLCLILAPLEVIGLYISNIPPNNWCPLLGMAPRAPGNPVWRILRDP